MLPDKWYTTIENNKKLINLKHLSTYYGTSMARLLDSKIFDSKLETLALSLDKGFEIEASINYLNRQTSLTKLLLLIENQLCNAIYTILQGCTKIKFDYQFATKNRAVLIMNVSRGVYFNHDKIIGKMLKIRLDGIWCTCPYSTSSALM